MARLINTIIIGGGQAGLALSYYLSRQGREHIIFEKGYQAAEAWRNHRWDSFTLVTPNWMIQLPGMEYHGNAPDAYLPKDDIVQLFEHYISRFQQPVQYNTCVTSVDKGEKYYQITTNQGLYQCVNVVIATGTYQEPKIPSFHTDLSDSIKQIHTSQYRNPDSLPPGAVLVVGAGQSGLQISEELYQSGRKVVQSVSNVVRLPRRYRGKDIAWWFSKIGNFDKTVDQLNTPKEKYIPFPQVSGKNGGHVLNLHQFAKDGVVLTGHLQGGADQEVIFSPNLNENLKKIDQNEVDTLKKIDDLIDREQMDLPLDTVPVMNDGYAKKEITKLNLKLEGITGIVWGSGYRFDYSMVHLPVFEEDGYPHQTHGVTAYPGLYFIGMVWLYKGKSSLLFGVGEDAAYLAEYINNNDPIK